MPTFSDYEIGYEPCPFCGHDEIHWRRCGALDCDDGFVDLYEDDPLWYNPGDIGMCQECHGTGTEQWCPKCGRDPREAKQLAEAC